MKDEEGTFSGKTIADIKKARKQVKKGDTISTPELIQKLRKDRK